MFHATATMTPMSKTPMSKLIVIMIDGVSADYFLKHKTKLPFLSRLADEGLWVERLHSVQPATSLPGRSTIMTGVESAVHGIWGNTIWDGERFRYATPDDVRVPTITRQAMNAGLDVAVLGYGMLRPEDAHVFHHAWWVGEMVQRARDNQPIAAHEGWLRTLRHKDETGRLLALAERGYEMAIVDPYAESDNPRLNYFAAELAGDARMMEWTAGLASSATPPDLIVTEILTPDSVQHVAGYESLLAHWSIAYADALVGQVLETLRQAGQQDYSFAIMSDHGHAPVDKAILPAMIIPEARYACECAWLYVHYESLRELKELRAKLAEYGVELADNSQVVKDYRHTIAAFLAPEGAAFESTVAEQAVALPQAISTHGLRPGNKGDDRFALFSGPAFSKAKLAEADALQVTPSLAKLLGLSLEPYPGESLY